MSSFGDFIALSDICDVATAKIISREVSDSSRSFQAIRGNHFRCSHWFVTAFVLENDPFYQEDFYWAICATL